MEYLLPDILRGNICFPQCLQLKKNAPIVSQSKNGKRWPVSRLAAVFLLYPGLYLSTFLVNRRFPNSSIQSPKNSEWLYNGSLLSICQYLRTLSCHRYPSVQYRRLPGYCSLASLEADRWQEARPRQNFFLMNLIWLGLPTSCYWASSGLQRITSFQVLSVR